MNWLSFFIGVLVGWIVEWFIDLFYWRRKYHSCQEEKEALQARLNEAERRIKTFQVKGWEVESEPQRTPSASVTEEAAAIVPPDADLDVDLKAPELALPSAEGDILAAAAAIGGVAAEPAERHAELPTMAPQGPDDLKLIEGIGPKISQLLKDDGILTFAQLADTSIDRLQAILRAAGPNFQLADPTTWPEQAKLAADGDWDGLRALQSHLIGGRKTRRWNR